MRIRTFTNCDLCVGGKKVRQNIKVDLDTGKIIEGSSDQVDSETVNFGGKTVAPGYLELQSNVGDAQNAAWRSSLGRADKYHSELTVLYRGF